MKRVIDFRGARLQRDPLPDLVPVVSIDQLRRNQATADAHHAAASCMTALQSAALGEPDPHRVEWLQALHAQATDLARMLQQLRGMK